MVARLGPWAVVWPSCQVQKPYQRFVQCRDAAICTTLTSTFSASRRETHLGVRVPQDLQPTSRSSRRHCFGGAGALPLSKFSGVAVADRWGSCMPERR